MKQTIVLLAMLNLVSCQISSQTGEEKQKMSTSFEKAMTGNLKTLDTAKAPTTFLMLANNFERIGNAERKYWQPFYFASLSYAYMAHATPDKSRIDPLIAKAEEFLQKAYELSDKNSEISTLQAMLTNLQILVDPIARFQEYSARSNELLIQAREQDPTNPRPYLVEARFLIYTPVAMGGGPDATKPVIEKAISMFKAFQPHDAIAPSWGLNQAEQILARINSK